MLYPSDLKSCYFLMISAYVPRPIALVSSLSAAGIGNVAPYSYSGCVGHDPPTLVVSCCRKPDGRSEMLPGRYLGAFCCVCARECLGKEMVSACGAFSRLC